MDVFFLAARLTSLSVHTSTDRVLIDTHIKKGVNVIFNCSSPDRPAIADGLWPLVLGAARLWAP